MCLSTCGVTFFSIPAFWAASASCFLYAAYPMRSPSAPVRKYPLSSYPNIIFCFFIQMRIFLMTSASSGWMYTSLMEDFVFGSPRILNASDHDFVTEMYSGPTSSAFKPAHSPKRSPVRARNSVVNAHRSRSNDSTSLWSSSFSRNFSAILSFLVSSLNNVSLSATSRPMKSFRYPHMSMALNRFSNSFMLLFFLPVSRSFVRTYPAVR